MPWRIWFEVFKNGEKIGSAVYFRDYKHKSSAVRRAKQMWDKDLHNQIDGSTIIRKWIVSQTNPYANGLRKGE